MSLGCQKTSTDSNILHNLASCYGFTMQYNAPEIRLCFHTNYYTICMIFIIKCHYFLIRKFSCVRILGSRFFLLCNNRENFPPFFRSYRKRIVHSFDPQLYRFYDYQDLIRFVSIRGGRAITRDWICEGKVKQFPAYLQRRQFTAVTLKFRARFITGESEAVENCHEGI